MYMCKHTVNSVYDWVGVPSNEGANHHQASWPHQFMCVSFFNVRHHLTLLSLKDNVSQQYFLTI